MKSILRLTLGKYLIEVNEVRHDRFVVSYGTAITTELNQNDAENALGVAIFRGLKAEKRLTPPPPPEITVDYELLETQLKALESVRIPGYLKGCLIDGVFDLLDAIVERRPFREVKDK